jgi:hypothetical protein
MKGLLNDIIRLFVFVLVVACLFWLFFSFAGVGVMLAIHFGGV